MFKLPIGQAAPKHYNFLLNLKIERTKKQFQALFNQSDCTNFDIIRSPVEHFRMRAEFKIWHEGEDSFYIMHDTDEQKTKIRIEHFSIGSKAICRLMPELMARIKTKEALRKKLFQVEFLTTLSGEALVSLIYHKTLDDTWTTLARELEEQLGIYIIGRSRKQKIVLSQDYVTESLTLHSGTYTYQQIETGFTQPNAAVCTDMLNWACKVSQNLSDDLLELYCGNANFTIPLSKNYTKVLATEISKISTRSAIHNIERNKCDNIDVVRLSAEEVGEAIAGKRVFRRLKHIDLNDYTFSTVFVDPPRSGMDASTCAMISKFQYIIYISCNPDSLLVNMGSLSQTHQIEHFALFDQFPYTEHRECGVMLKRKN